MGRREMPAAKAGRRRETVRPFLARKPDITTNFMSPAAKRALA
jgi:hypothetical protein